jgi:hypothetical protein
MSELLPEILVQGISRGFVGATRTLDFFLFFLSLWIYLWLAETSQQPINQTTWLKGFPNISLVATTLVSYREA